MPYRNGRYVHPDQLPSNERDEWYERNPPQGSWGYVVKQKREANHREAEEDLKRNGGNWEAHNKRVEERKKQEAKRQREAEEGTTNEQEENNE